jgi:hypothetical protein
MTSFHHASELAYQVEPGWVDRSEYSYVRGEFRFYVRQFGAASDARARADLALAKFARNVPRHAVIERRAIDAPGPGELVVHQLPGDPGAVEIFMYWAVGDRCWLCRATGPLDAEPECRRIIDGFIETYEPVEGP